METLNLKCIGVKLWGDRQTWRRWRKTIQFMEKHGNMEANGLLDIGPSNQFGQKVADYFGLEYFHTTKDLNNPQYDRYPYRHFHRIVFFSHVIEHLYNPGTLLNYIKNIIYDDSQIFIMYPRTPRFLWNNRHFHEYSRKAFLSLIDYSGYEVVAYETHRGWHNWYFYFTGFRPFIRFWCTVFNWHNNEYYLLRLKDD